MNMQAIDCVVCGNQGYEFLQEVQDLRLKTNTEPLPLVRCSACSLVYVNPRPAEDAFATFYPRGYYRPYVGIWDRIHSPLSEWSLSRIVRELRRFKKRGKLLDVGCGTGYLLERLQEAGYDVYGAEPSAEAPDLLPAGMRERVMNKAVQDCQFDRDYFDIITIKQVLEHVADPSGLLRELHRILGKDGILYIEVPNYGCPEARLFGRHWYNLEVPRHLYQFTEGTLRRLLETNGFRLEALLTNSGVMLFKSPLAVYNSLRYALADSPLGRYKMARQFTEALLLFPALALTLLLRGSTWNGAGMDIRAIFRKAEQV